MLSSVGSAKNEHRHACRSEKYSNERKKARASKKKKHRRCSLGVLSRRAMASPDDHDSFRAATKRRIIDDMLGKVAATGGGEWKVLIVDPVTMHRGVRVLRDERPDERGGFAGGEPRARPRAAETPGRGVLHLSLAHVAAGAVRRFRGPERGAAPLRARARLLLLAHLAGAPRDAQAVPRARAQPGEPGGAQPGVPHQGHAHVHHRPAGRDAGVLRERRTRAGGGGSVRLGGGGDRRDASRAATLLASLGEFPTIRYKDRGVDGAAGTSPAANRRAAAVPDDAGARGTGNRQRRFG